MANLAPQASPDPAESTWPNNRAILINSLVALLLGAGVTVLIHEAAHWVAGALLGSPSYLYAFGVEHVPPLAGRDAAVAALAGPAVSLVVGLVMQILQPFRFRGDFVHLLWIWIAGTSLMEATTYLVITPFAGDTAVAARELGLPGWASWVAAAIGVLGMVGVAHLWAVHSVRLCGHDLSRLRSLSWYPWLIAIPVNLALGLAFLSTAGMALSPQEQVVIILAGMAQTVFAPMSLPFSHRVRELEEPLEVTPFPVAGAIGFAALVAFNFAISGGLRLG
ncbi:MAG: hypothetical protein QM582_15640 [Micropruina sp.]|uniref:hypothetical protein n=1 Tax=Micropruina sp. TaxID=2737536 RepID=UPI0039E54241